MCRIFGQLVGMAVCLLAFMPQNASAQIDLELCAKRDPENVLRRHRGRLLQSNEDIYKLLLEGGERVILETRDYEPCKALPPPTSAKPVVAPLKPPGRPLPEQAFDRLTIIGSGTVSRGVLPHIIKAYAAAIGAELTSTPDAESTVYELRLPRTNTPFLQIVVKATGSNQALPALVDRKADVGVSSTSSHDEQIETLIHIRGFGSRSEIEHVIALDGIVIVVHPANPVTAISLCDVARIYSGKIRNWQALGGTAGPIEVHDLSPSSGTFEVFRQLVMQACNEPAVFGAAIPHTDQPGVRAAVVKNPGSIGFIGRSEFTDAMRAVRIRGKCGVEVAATRFNIKSEDYPLSRRLFMFTPYSVGRNAQAFLDFALTDIAAQEALKDGEATNLTIKTTAQDEKAEQSGKLAENQDSHVQIFRADTAGARRVSISFRFQFGSSLLDTKAQADIRRLVEYLQRTPGHKAMLLAGFADSIGGIEQNRRLAESRAEAVRKAIAALDPALASRAKTKGYGKIFPVACNDTTLGREKNRRVEVWLH